MDNLNEYKLGIEQYIKENNSILYHWVSQCKLLIVAENCLVYICPEELLLIASSLEFLVPLSNAIKSVVGTTLSIVMIPETVINQNSLLDLYSVSLPSEATNV